MALTQLIGANSYNFNKLQESKNADFCHFQGLHDSSNNGIFRPFQNHPQKLLKAAPQHEPL